MSGTPKTFEEWWGDQSIDAYESDFARIAWNAAIDAACARILATDRTWDHGSVQFTFTASAEDMAVEVAKLKTTKETPR